jgi:hypothetical protein
MYRTIAVAAVIFGFAAFALHNSPVAGRFEEPLLLLLMGTLFLVVAKVFAVPTGGIPVAERTSA